MVGARVAVGLGGNVGDRLAVLQAAVERMRSVLNHLEVSSVYETVPRHVTDQPAFLNACCIGRTPLTARQLLSELQHIERMGGRQRGGARYGPRSLDLDLLLYGDAVIDEPGLTVPHPRMHERAFVLVPLAELAPGQTVPAHAGLPAATVATLARAVGSAGVERTGLALCGE